VRPKLPAIVETTTSVQSQRKPADNETGGVASTVTAAKTEATDSNIAYNDAIATKVETIEKDNARTAESSWWKAGQESESLRQSGFFQQHTFDDVIPCAGDSEIDELPSSSV
jgi:hypothetical protein